MTHPRKQSISVHPRPSAAHQPSAGRWYTECYQSGTRVVKRADHGPWLDVGMRNVPHHTEAERARIKHDAANDIVAYLNGGERPTWLDDLERTNEIRMNGADGLEICACGPMYDANPPACQWETCMDTESVNGRCRLIDKLHLGRPW